MGSRTTTSTATVLFTDLVGSTELRSRLGEEVADHIRRAHDEAVTRAIEQNAGNVVKSLGDGLMAVFESAADAVAAAIAAQQAVAALEGNLPEPIAIRVGSSVGDVSVEDEDYFGTAVNEAARLCGAANGGQILVADLVRALARGRGGFTFEFFGDLDLKGLPDPVATCSVGWARLPEVSNQSIPFPPGLVPGTGGLYIGRPDVRAALLDLWHDTDLHGARTALLAGEPGIGKTRTAYELASEAGESGAVVLFGRCDDQLRMSYQPFVEALDWQTRHAPDLPLGRLPGELARLVPDLEGRCPGLEPPVASDPRTEEHRLFEAVASWLESMARESGLVLVLDDLQWATMPTLQMLVHLLRHASGLGGLRLLVIGTYRDTDVDRSHPVASVLGDLQRIEGVRRIAVDPLDVDEVIELAEAAAGHALDEVTRGVAARTHAETQGNPFFVHEVLRNLIESGAIQYIDGAWVAPDPEHIEVPDGVRAVVGQRLSRLSDRANDVLRAASVIGREFDIDLVAELVGVDEGPLLDAIDEANRARLIEEVGADRYRFAHALVRAWLYDELSASRRRRMHRRVLELVRKTAPHDLSALAHHSIQAGPMGGDLSDAIGYVLAAAGQARDERGLSEAQNLYQKALDLLAEDDAEPLDERRLLARCAIGEILRDQGNPEFRDALLEVARDALAEGRDVLLVRAVLANSRGLTSTFGQIDAERIELIEVALDRVAPEAVADRARLEGLLAAELMFDFGRRDERLALADHAVSLLDGLDDPLTEAWVLSITRLPEMIPERWTDDVAKFEHAVEVADRCGDPNLKVTTRIALCWKLLSCAELASAQQILAEALGIAVIDAGPIAQWTVRALSCQFTLLGGDLVRTAEENDLALDLGTACGAPDAMLWWGGVAATIGWMTDATIGDPDLAGQFADQFPGTPNWRAAQALSLAERGRFDECRALMSEHDLGDPESHPKDALWMHYAMLMSRIALLLDDEGLARRLVAAYEPHASASVHFLIGINGSMRQFLSWAKTAAGDLDGAVSDARFALEWLNERGFLPAYTAACVETAELLARRGSPEDLDEARALLTVAIADAERMGMVGWLARAEDQRQRVSPPPGEPEGQD